MISNNPKYESWIKMLSELPQAKHFTRERMDAWLAATYAVYPDNVEWHIARLRGIGGSEIGTILASRFGQYSFSSKEEIASKKLLYSYPDPPSGHTLRGSNMEDTVRQMFMKQMNASRDDDAIHAVLKHQDSQYPWLVGNPDDIVIMDGKRFIVDYKCPMPGFAKEYDRNGIPFAYNAQLHNYALIATRAGVPVHGLILCSLDFENWNLDIRFVDESKEITEAIQTEGDAFWKNHVLSGKVPKETKQKEQKVEIKDKEILHDLDQIAWLSLLKNSVSSRMDEIKEQVEKKIREKYGDSEKLTSGVINIHKRRTPDNEKIKSYAQQYGLDLSRFERQVTEIDWDAVMKELHGLGVDHGKITSEKMVIGLSRTPNERMQDMKEEVESLLESFLEEAEAKPSSTFANLKF